MSSHGRPPDQQRLHAGVDRVQPSVADMPKVVFSSTTQHFARREHRLSTGDAVTEITSLKADDGGPMDIAVPLAAAAMAAGLIDGLRESSHPVLVGGGTPVFTPGHTG